MCDDDQGIGVLAAITQAHRSEFFMVGGAGSANAMRLIKADSGVLKATVLYPPTMASSAIRMARLIAHSKGMSDLAQQEVPQRIRAQHRIHRLSAHNISARFRHLALVK